MNLKAQAEIDTVCTNSGTSRFGVPYVADQSYYWQVAGGQIISKPDSNVIEVDWSNTPGIYEVSVVASNSYGCPGDTSRYIIVMNGPNMANAKGPTKVCEGTYCTIESAIVGDFMWEGGETTQSIGFMAKKDTVISLIALNNPCPNDTLQYFIEVSNSPSADMNYVEDTVLINSEETFYYTGSESSPNLEWIHNGRSISTRSAVKIEFKRSGEHIISQIVRNDACADTISQMVYVDDIFKIFIPNAFTPNGDGVNDYFTFEGVGIKSFTAQIFNRWGERVFEWNDQTPVPGWDGTNHGRDSKIDAYIYKISVEDYSGETHFFTDQFSLLR